MKNNKNLKIIFIFFGVLVLFLSLTYLIYVTWIKEMSYTQTIDTDFEDGIFNQTIVKGTEIDSMIELVDMPFLQFKEPRDLKEREKIFVKQEKVRRKIGRRNITELTSKELQKIEEIKDWHYALKNPFFKLTELTSKYLERSRIAFDHLTFEATIMLKFNEEGDRLLEEITARNVNRPMAIYIDDVLISAPVIREKITGGEAMISNGLTTEEASELVRKLNAIVSPFSGTFISLPIDTGQNSNFTTLDFTIIEPVNTDIKFQLRTAPTQIELEEAIWYGPTGNYDFYTIKGTEINIIHDGYRWIQYKVFFNTADARVTPSLLDITINFRRNFPF